MAPTPGSVGNGILLWFIVDDFDVAWERAGSMPATIHETPNSRNGTGVRAFAVRDPDDYYVAVNEPRP
ncbi:MAG: hypothetical protein ABIZ91_00230 [Gemmatimonadaceae bacterium]